MLLFYQIFCILFMFGMVVDSYNGIEQLFENTLKRRLFIVLMFLFSALVIPALLGVYFSQKSTTYEHE